MKLGRLLVVAAMALVCVGSGVAVTPAAEQISAYLVVPEPPAPAAPSQTIEQQLTLLGFIRVTDTTEWSPEAEEMIARRQWQKSNYTIVLTDRFSSDQQLYIETIATANITGWQLVWCRPDDQMSVSSSLDQLQQLSRAAAITKVSRLPSGQYHFYRWPCWGTK